MDRRPGRRAARIVLALLAVATALAMAPVLRALPAADLEAAGIGWALVALAGVLLVASAIGLVATIVSGLRHGSLSALLVAGGAAALVGGAAALLTGSASISLTVTAAALLVLGAAVAERLETLVHGRGARIAVAGAVLAAAEVAAVVEILPAGAAFLAPLTSGLLGVAAALGFVAALVVVGRELAAASGILTIGAVTLALARGGDALFALGLAALTAGVLLAARAALGAERTAPATAGDWELPPLADQLADGILRFDGHLQLRSWNRGAAELLGLDDASAGERLEDLLGLTLQQLPTEEDAAIHHTSLGGLELSIRRGADAIDVVVRDANTSSDAERLGRELRGTIEELLQARRTIELQRAELERASAIDALTGVASRGAILDRLQVEVAQARRYQHTVAVVLVDVDHFGELNAAHGLSGGDTILREVALRVRLRVREADTLGRAGSDGLLAILPHTDESGAAIFADALLRRIGQRPISLADAEVAVTVSVGVAVMRPGEDLGVDGLLARGEEALASARGAGGDRIALDRLHGLARLEPKTGPPTALPPRDAEQPADDTA